MGENWEEGMKRRQKQQVRGEERKGKEERRNTKMIGCDLQYDRVLNNVDYKSMLSVY